MAKAKSNHIQSLTLEKFTAFEKNYFEFSPGINVFVGRNGTGKTHLLKVLYAITFASKKNSSVSKKIQGCFKPYQGGLGRLVRRSQGVRSAKITAMQAGETFNLTFSTLAKSVDSKNWPEAKSSWKAYEGECAFIPVKEMMVHAAGFGSVLRKYDLPFEDVYADIIDLALLPRRIGPVAVERQSLLKSIQKVIDGKVEQTESTFFLTNSEGKLEFSLVAEGMRKLALIWVLIQNGTLGKGTHLFWDEPEANLNPSLFGPIAEIVIQLQRSGVQIFFATHSYLLLKELERIRKKEDEVLYHSIYTNATKLELENKSTPVLADLPESAVSEIYDSLLERQIEDVLGKGKKLL